MGPYPEQPDLADLLVEALGHGGHGSLARALCGELLRGALGGPRPPRTFGALAHVLEGSPGAASGDRAALVWTVRGIAQARPDLALADFARDHRGRRGPGRR